MLLEDLSFTPCAIGEKILHGIGVQLQLTVGEYPAMCMTHSTGPILDVHGKKSQYNILTIYLTSFSDGADAFDCALPGFHVSYPLDRQFQTANNRNL